MRKVVALLALVVVLFVTAWAGPAHSRVNTNPVCSGVITVQAGYVNGTTTDPNCQGPDVRVVATINGKIADTRGFSVMSVNHCACGGITVYLNTKNHDLPITVAYFGFTDQ
jgi:hypothetical protein